MGSLGNKKLIVAAMVIVAAIVVLSVRAFGGSAAYYYELSELAGKPGVAYGHTVKVKGTVAEGSIEVTGDGETTFELTDGKQGSSLAVVYDGALPDGFREGGDVVCEGRLAGEGFFRAQLLMPKCPARYQPSTTPTVR